MIIPSSFIRTSAKWEVNSTLFLIVKYPVNIAGCAVLIDTTEKQLLKAKQARYHTIRSHLSASCVNSTISLKLPFKEFQNKIDNSYYTTLTLRTVETIRKLWWKRSLAQMDFIASRLKVIKVYESSGREISL